MRTRSLLFAAAVLIACQPSPEDPVYILGLVTAGDGKPLEGETVSIERRVQTYDPNAQARGPDQDEQITTVAVESDGLFVAEVLYFYAMALPGKYPAWFQARLPERDGRGETLARFFPPTSDVELPTLTPWAVHVDGLLSSQPVSLEQQPPPAVPEALDAFDFGAEPAPERGPQSTLPQRSSSGPLQTRLELTSPTGLAWSSKSLDPNDAELREDFELTARAHATWWGVPAGTSGFQQPSVWMSWSSPRVAFQTGNVVPRSRSATCDAENTPCAWNDGKLDLASGSIASLRFDTPFLVRRIILRGVVLPDVATLHLATLPPNGVDQFAISNDSDNRSNLAPEEIGAPGDIYHGGYEYFLSFELVPPVLAAGLRAQSTVPSYGPDPESPPREYLVRLRELSVFE